MKKFIKRIKEHMAMDEQFAINIIVNGALDYLRDDQGFGLKLVCKEID